MSGGWSRYTRGAASGQGTGCGSSIVAAIVIGFLVAVAAQLLGFPGDDCMQTFTCTNAETSK